MIQDTAVQLGYSDTGEWQQLKYRSLMGTYCCLFLDDILIVSRTLEEHPRHLRQICVLVQHSMYLNYDKIEICQPEITYLGNFVGRYGIHPTPNRAQVLLSWPTLQSVTELKSFLGLMMDFLLLYMEQMRPMLFWSNKYVQ